MAQVGYLLLFWGGLVRRLGTAPVPPALCQVRTMRNMLCHGLQRARSNPGVHEPFLVCRYLAGDSVEYSFTQLDEPIRELERFRGVPL